jgi:membrane fusion protein (multidrug efflux system)
VAESLLAYFKAGQKVPVKIIAYNKEVTGTIEDYDPVADAQTKNVFLKVKIPAQEKVAENMSASVYVPVSEKKELSIIPRDALIKMNGQDFVYTVKEGKSAILPVNIVTYLGEKIGADNPYFTEGMVVVVVGNERLRPDQPVVVAGEK